MEALDLWAAQRAYPGRILPDAGHALAFGYDRVLRGSSTSGPPGAHPVDTLVGPWTSLGPTNIGGRTLALALVPGHPDTMFAGSASGGLWKTTTGGAGPDAWDRVETGFPLLSVSSIAINPADPAVMYIGTGEVYRYQGSIGGDVDRTTRGSYGIGILKSGDGGGTWSRSLDWTFAQSRGIQGIRIHPRNPDIVYAATTEGVYKSTDAGGSWTRVHTVIMATDIRIHPTMPETVLVACGNFGSAGNGIYRTHDGGQTWTRLTAGLPSSWTGKALLAIAPSTPHVVYASIANTFAGFGLYKSLDGGDAWTRVNNTDFQMWQGWYSHWVLVSPTNVNRVFVGGIDIWRSTNGGATLTQVSDWTQAYFGTPPPEGPGGGPQWAHADHHDAVWHPTEANTAFFVSDGGVFKTTNGGDTFTGQNGGYVTSQFYQGFSNSGSDSALAMGGMQDNFTAIYEGGPAWRRVIGGDGSWTAINPLDDGIRYGSAQGLQLFRSVDGGADWQGISPPQQGGDVTAFIAPYVLAPSLPTRIYAARSRVYRSDSGGSGWLTTNGNAPLDGNAVFTMAVAAADPDVVFAATTPGATRGKVFRSVNGGLSWTDVTGILPDRYISDIAVDPDGGYEVYITLMGFGSSHLYRSQDRGDTWIDAGDGLPDVPASSVALDPDHPQIVYVGTDLGVYVSPFKGRAWYPFTNGMPTAMVNDLVPFAPTRTLRAATHGNGVYERDLLDLYTTDIPDTAPSVAGDPDLRVVPNPLTADGRITFTLREPGRVRLDLFDVQGRRVALLLDERRGAGEQTVALPADRLSGGRLARAVYFVRLTTREGTAITRVVALR
jgi:hypothetical protein